MGYFTLTTYEYKAKSFFVKVKNTSPSISPSPFYGEELKEGEGEALYYQNRYDIRSLCCPQIQNTIK
jgi:hypothetical protein